jgi:ATP-dependent DNA ligase
MLQRTFPAGFIAPCLPTKTDKLPSGDLWLHEIKHDGFRVIARKDGDRVQLYSRAGNDMTHRFPQIVEALGRLRSRSCIIDGEAVACDDNGLASFERIRYLSTRQKTRCSSIQHASNDASGRDTRGAGAGRAAQRQWTRVRLLT